MAQPSKPTPPHAPTYNVHLSAETIKAIIPLAVPGRELVTCEQLESGKSFNNRIYFIETRPTSSSSQQLTEHEHERLVLKVAGHYFGTLKVQNEIGSLLLLQKYCPSVPFPRVVAWSTDGSVIQNIHGDVTDTKSPQQQDTALTPDIINAFSHHSWILLTRKPGRLVTQADLDGPHGIDILKELALHLSTWRTQMPPVSSIGNIRFCLDSDNPTSPQNEQGKQQQQPIFDLLPHPDQSNDKPSLNIPKFTIGGLLLCYTYNPAPLPTALAYHTYLVTDQFQHLCQTPVLKPLHGRIHAQVETFLANMPRLSFLKSREPPIRFSHMDFAPRNVLVSADAAAAAAATDGGDGNQEGEGRLHVTGMVDVEFAAFLPGEDEFLNMSVRQKGDWTREQHEVIVTELARLGIQVPHLRGGKHEEPVCTSRSEGICTCDNSVMEGLEILARVSENIAPWFIYESSHGPEELQEQFDIAEKGALDGIAELDRFMT